MIEVKAQVVDLNDGGQSRKDDAGVNGGPQLQRLRRGPVIAVCLPAAA